MKLGIHLPQYGRSAAPDAIVRVAREAEATGYADVWVSDHIVQPADQGYPSPFLYDPMLTLGWAAAVTGRIGLGTSVLVIPQYHPVQLANSLASLDNLSGGRLTVAAGVGWSRGEFDALGQDFSTRGARMDEAIDILRAAWTEDPVSFRGAHYHFDDLRILPKPAHEIPIWIGGGGTAALRRAAGRGDGYHAISTAPEDLAPILAALRRRRPDPAFTMSYRTGWDPQGMDHGLIVEEAAAYAEVGITHVVAAPWRATVDDWLRSMELLMGLVGTAAA